MTQIVARSTFTHQREAGFTLLEALAMLATLAFFTWVLVAVVIYEPGEEDSSSTPAPITTPEAEAS